MSCRERLPDEHSDPAVASAAGTRELLAMVAQLRAAYRKRPNLPVAVRRAHLESLQALVREIHGLRPNATTEPACVHRARQYIAAHLTEQFTAGMVAKEVGLCPQQFRKRFKQATGQTFRQYLTLRRLERAKDLLVKTDRTVLAVSLDAGFQSLSAFYRAFRKHAGQSADKYRRSVVPL